MAPRCAEAGGAAIPGTALPGRVRVAIDELTTNFYFSREKRPHTCEVSRKTFSFKKITKVTDGGQL